MTLLFVVEAAVLEGATLGGAVSRSLRLAGSQSGEAVVATLALVALHAGATLLGDDVGRTLVSDLSQFREPLIRVFGRLEGAPSRSPGFWASSCRYVADGAVLRPPIPRPPDAQRGVGHPDSLRFARHPGPRGSRAVMNPCTARRLLCSAVFLALLGFAHAGRSAPLDRETAETDAQSAVTDGH